MPDDLFVHCPDENCHFHQDPIRLLISNPSQITADQSLWPWDESDLYLSCPGCNVVSVHSHADVRDFPPSVHSGHPDHKDWFRISFRCATVDCHTPVEFHALMGTWVLGKTETVINARLRSQEWKGVTPCGHPIYAMPHQYVAISPNKGAMYGYNSKDFRWQAIR